MTNFLLVHFHLNEKINQTGHMLLGTSIKKDKCNINKGQQQSYCGFLIGARKRHSSSTEHLRNNTVSYTLFSDSSSCIQYIYPIRGIAG